MAATVNIVLDPAAVDLDAGQEQVIGLSVRARNDNDGPLQCRVVVDDCPWVTVEPAEFSVFPGQERRGRLLLQPPPETPSARYQLTVRCLDQRRALAEVGRRELQVQLQGAATTGWPAAETTVPMAPVTPVAEPAQAAALRAEPDDLPPPSAGSLAPGSLGRPAVEPTPPANVPPAGLPAWWDAAQRVETRQLELRAERGFLSVAPGELVSVGLGVASRAGVVLGLELSTLGVPPSWLRLEPATFDAVPGQTRLTRLTLAPPTGARPGNYQLVVTARDRTGTVDAVRLALAVEIGAGSTLTVAIVGPREVDGELTADFTVQVAVSPPRPLQVRLSANDAESACDYAFTPATLHLAADGTGGESRLTVRARSRLDRRYRRVEFRVQAVVVDDRSLTAETTGAFVQQPAQPFLVTIAPAQTRGVGQASHSVRIENPNRAATTVQLTGSDAAGACDVNFVPALIDLPAQGAAEVRLEVTPHERLTGRAERRHRVTVRVDPTDGVLAPASAAAEYVQVPAPRPRLELDPLSRAGAGETTYRVALTNPAEQSIEVELVAVDPAGNSELAIRPRHLTLAPNATGAAQLTVRPVRSLLAGETQRTLDFAVEARVAEAPDEPVRVAGTLIQVRRRWAGGLPRWLWPVAALVLLVPLAFWLLSLLPGGEVPGAVSIAPGLTATARSQATAAVAASTETARPEATRVAEATRLAATQQALAESQRQTQATIAAAIAVQTGGGSSGGGGTSGGGSAGGGSADAVATAQAIELAARSTAEAIETARAQTDATAGAVAAADSAARATQRAADATAAAMTSAPVALAATPPAQGGGTGAAQPAPDETESLEATPTERAEPTPTNAVATPASAPPERATATAQAVAPTVTRVQAAQSPTAEAAAPAGGAVAARTQTAQAGAATQATQAAQTQATQAAAAQLAAGATQTAQALAGRAATQTAQAAVRPTTTTTATPLPAATPVDLVALAGRARWQAGTPNVDLTFPGVDADTRGFASYRRDALLADGSRPPQVLETHPRAVTGGFIEGCFTPAVLSGYTARATDRIGGRVGYLDGGKTGDVNVRLIYREPGLTPINVWTMRLQYADGVKSVDQSMRDLVGHLGDLCLRVDARAGTPADWSVIWQDLKITR